MPMSGRSGDGEIVRERLELQGSARGAGYPRHSAYLIGSRSLKGRAERLDLQGLERERGLEPPTLCLGIRLGLGPLQSTRVRRRVFDRPGADFRVLRTTAIVHLCPSVWLQ